MRVLIMHSGEGKIADLAQSLQRSFEKEGSRADLVSAAEGSTPISSAPYDLVCLLSSFSGLFKPKVPVEIDNILKRCTRLEGKKGAAFVPAKLGSTKALRLLMSLMERQGMIVDYFSTLSSPADAQSAAQRLASTAR
ncbi:MAG TPA: hypothetical protein GX008_01460 [Firmicutes bacterium]|nr:MAG: hypothetical protein AA931_06800 [Peptococcaceae bacterium 1109]HHT72361.1 hypothetical protein [Bacillota bacterium]